eukprot:CFRG3558T1
MVLLKIDSGVALLALCFLSFYAEATTATYPLKCAVKPTEQDSKYMLQVLERSQEWRDCGTTEIICYQNGLREALSHWETKSISKEDIQRALGATRSGVLYQIVDGKLYRSGGVPDENRCVFPMRCDGIEHMLNKVLEQRKGPGQEQLPNIEFVLNERDYPMSLIGRSNRHPIFSFSRNTKYIDIMYPNWSFYKGGPCIKSEPECLGRWDLKIESMTKASRTFPWAEKEEVAFFRGSRTSKERDPLIQLSRSHPHLVKARYVKNQSWRSRADTLGEEPAEEVTLDDHCKYKFLFNFKGVAASFRFRHLFLCGSLVFHVLDEDDDWMEFFYKEMRPWVHYIPVKKDLSNCQELIEWAMRYDGIAEKVATAGQKFVLDHLRMEDVYTYWYHLLLNYSKLVKYKVKAPAAGAVLLT